LTKKCIIKDR